MKVVELGQQLFGYLRDHELWELLTDMGKPVEIIMALMVIWIDYHDCVVHVEGIKERFYHVRVQPEELIYLHLHLWHAIWSHFDAREEFLIYFRASFMPLTLFLEKVALVDATASVKNEVLDFMLP